MIKLDNAIPQDVPDGTNPIVIKEFLTQLKLSVEEMARKAKSMQMEVRSAAAGVNDVEEGEDVRAVIGGVYSTYTKINGAIKAHTEV